MPEVDGMKNPCADAGRTPPCNERRELQRWLTPLGGFGIAAAILVAALAGAEEPERIAQAADSEPSVATSDSSAAADPVEPDPSADKDSSFRPGIEEIIVLGAESEGTRDFEAADSVTGFGAEDLAALGAQDIADLAAFTPNLEIVTYGSTSPTFFIRGVGLNDFNSNSTGAVAIYQDDVARNAPALQLSTLFDVETVNVLRGPQGTGLARNASAGAIKIYSRKPTGEFSAYLRSELGNYDARDFEGAIEVPILEDMLAGRFAFRFTERDGTMKNRCGDAPPFDERVEVPNPGGPGGLKELGKSRDDPPWSICHEVVASAGSGTTGFSEIPEGLESRVNNIDNWAARGTLLFQPTLDMTWLLNAHGSRRDELSRLGQSIGTGGFFCANGDTENCDFAGQPNTCVAPPENVGNACSLNSDCDSVGGENNGVCTSKVVGRLGGRQGATGSGYVPREIQQRLEQLAPCLKPIPGRPTGTCDLGGPDQAANRALVNRAKIIVANELAQDLDTRPWQGDFNRTGPTRNDTWGAYLNGDIVLPLGMEFTSVTSFDTYDRLIDIDLDFSPETLFHIITDDEGWQIYQDFRLQGEIGDDAPLRWDVGTWFLREQLDVVVSNDLGTAGAFGVGSRDYTQDLWSAAGYASLSFDFWNNFTLNGGVRYNWEQKKLDYALITGIGAVQEERLDDTWHDPTGTVRLTYRFRDDTHIFWKYTRGWKPGTYNATSSRLQGVSVARPESIDAFETGLRGSWFDGRLGLDASFFYYSYEDYQLFTAQQFASGQPEFVIINADDAEVYGAEIDAQIRPWIGAFVNVRFGWLKSQFIDFVQLQQEQLAVPGATIIVNRELQNTGNNLLNSPELKVSLTAEQTFPLGRWGSLIARYDAVWTDVTYYDATEGRGIPNQDNIQFMPDDTIAQPEFWLHNFQLVYQPPGGRFEITGWVRNMTNESFKTFGFDGSTFNQTSIYFVGDPRTYGGTLTINF